jgi:hypothetical protein
MNRMLRRRLRRIFSGLLLLALYCTCVRTPRIAYSELAHMTEKRIMNQAYKRRLNGTDVFRRAKGYQAGIMLLERACLCGFLVILPYVGI